ncbi:general transcription factor IIH subunit 1-like protein [Dinothrombium tinctorium]|uniref:General transcription factor IIH subunit 1 n=1 Tax=Dinothrombium tinctorium TaxID=1965070 RepID=A0A443QKX3_9ACAR|nr:general transcription factor IIH subunit 1-like protein [Dinothrombium tinctorium]
MSTSSEDVLLLCNEVRHKKNDGILYLMAERIAWMPNGKDTFTISHKYEDIKMQKISPDGKPKIQLQVVLHNNETTTFHFVAAEGAKKQLQMRNEVKELLSQLLPKFKKKIPKELEAKNKILSDDPDLYQLYKDLVVSQIITADEFWTQLAPIRCPALVNILNISPPVTNKPGFASIASNHNQAQAVGISAAFLSDIKPQTDGCNGIKYNITTDIIEAIFRTYPAVKRKHFENVPHKISESEFWTRFFQSHYFHRDRVFTGSGSVKGDLFADCAKSDEHDVEKALRSGVNDPFVDLTYFDDCDYLNKLDELKRKDSVNDLNSKSGKNRDKEVSSGSSLLNANQALIKRFNHHSYMVLEASLSKERREDKINARQTNGNVKSLNNSHKERRLNESDDESDLDSVKVKKKRLLEKTHLEELNEEAQIDCSLFVNKGTKPLNITNKERYLVGPTPVTNNGYDSSHHNSYSHSDASSLFSSVRRQDAVVSHWKPLLSTCLTSQGAVTALSELSPGGALLKSSHSIVLKDVIPLDIQKELKQLYFSCNELFRHFWSCFPVTNEKLEEKLIQMKTTLERFQYTKLQPLHERLIKERCDSELTSHILSQLHIAYNKFTAWQAKRNTLVRK